MAPEKMEETSPEILQGLATSPDPNAQAAVAAPRVPPPAAPAVSAAAASPSEADESSQTDEELGIHPVDNMAMAFMSHLLDKDKTAESQPAPGSFGSKLSGALSAAGAGLGDMRTGGDPARGHGWLSAVGATLEARSERKMREHAQTFEEQERLKNDQINIAKANIEMRHTAMMIQQQEKTMRDANAQAGSTFMDALREGFKVQDNISQDDLMNMAKKDPEFLQTHTAAITGYRPVIGADGKPKMDKEGAMIEQPMFSIVDLAPGDVSKLTKVTPELAKQWEASGLHHIAPGTMLPASTMADMNARSQRYAVAFGMIARDRLQPLPDAVKDELASTMENPEVQHAIGMHRDSVLEGLYEAQKNVKAHIAQAQDGLQAMQGQPVDPDKLKAAQQNLADLQKTSADLDKVVNLGFTDAERNAHAKEVDQARKDAEKERHDRAEEAIQNKRADALAKKEAVDKSLADSYKIENREFDTIRKPLTTKLEAFSTLRSSLDQGTAAGDSVVAPALLKALVAGGGVRITQAEISQFTHGRSTIEDLKAVLNKMANGRSITDVQRQQVYALLGAVESKAQQKAAALEAAQDSLDTADTVLSQRQVVSGLNKQLDAIDGLAQAAPVTAPKAAPATPAAPKVHKVGDTIYQNGHPFKVTSVDKNGKVTGAS